MIAITGASGFLGRHLAARLKSDGERFVCLTRRGSLNAGKLRQIGCEIRTVDFENAGSIADSLAGCEALIHLLGLINGTDSELAKANVLTTQNVTEAAKRAGIKSILYVSSVAALMRHGPYGISKHQGEERLRESGISFTILRPAYIYGRGDRRNTERMLNVIKKWPFVPLLGGGSFRLQPVFVEDVVELILKALRKPFDNQTYTVAGPAQISLREMLTEFSSALNRHPIFIPIPLRPLQIIARAYVSVFPNTRLPIKQILELDKHSAFDISETVRDFDFHPVSFTEGVKRMFKSDKSVVRHPRTVLGGDPTFLIPA